MDLRSEFRKRLLRFEEVSCAFFFGSRPGGRARVDSDWDVAVYLSEDLSPKQRFQARLRINSELAGLGQIDLVVLNDAPPLLAHRVLTGERIFVRDAPLYTRFFVRTMSQLSDESYWLSFHTKARERRIREGRFGRP